MLHRGKEFLLNRMAKLDYSADARLRLNIVFRELENNRTFRIHLLHTFRIFE